MGGFWSGPERQYPIRRGSGHVAEAGFVWDNEVAKHFLGASFGGVNQ